MNKNLLAIAIGLLAGGVVLAIVLLARAPAPVLTTAAGPALHFDQSAGTEERIRALEAAVAEERNARMLLEEELQALYAVLDELDELRTANARSGGGREPRFQIDDARQQDGADETALRRSRLVEAGFADARAEWILKRESELRMESMQAMYEYRRTGERPENFDVIRDPSRALRAEIGDLEYEQYLDASGYPTSVNVGSLLDSSPGQRAGLQPGDEIMAYGGERVFTYDDLRTQTMAAAPGQPVVVDVVRDGVPIQIVIDGGPIGIASSNYRSRRR